jgi:hypothetical protein
MNMQCPCGFDYSDFVNQHSIPASARFACPNCEAQVTSAGPDSPAGSRDCAAAIPESPGPAAAQETLTG